MDGESSVEAIKEDGNDAIHPMKQTGKWAWSGWQNVTINTGTKTTINAVVAAMTSYIPYVGPIATAFATIIIQKGIKTGYFKRSDGSRMDTDPNYIWRSTKVKLYKDKARTKLLKSDKSSPKKVLIQH